MTSVELKQVAKPNDGRPQVMHGIDLEIQRGEFVVFFGPPAYGKSTFLRMISGLERITAKRYHDQGKAPARFYRKSPIKPFSVPGDPVPRQGILDIVTHPL